MLQLFLLHDVLHNFTESNAIFTHRLGGGSITDSLKTNWKKKIVTAFTLSPQFLFASTYWGQLFSRCSLSLVLISYALTFQSL